MELFRPNEGGGVQPGGPLFTASPPAPPPRPSAEERGKARAPPSQHQAPADSDLSEGELERLGRDAATQAEVARAQAEEDRRAEE